MHMDWKDAMETPDGNGQEQGSNIVTDHTSSDTKKATTCVKKSKSTPQNPESPREGHEDRKPGTMIWESHCGVGRYGLEDPGMTAGSGTQGGKVKEKGRTALAKVDVVQNEALYNNTRPRPISREQSPIATTLSVPEGSRAANYSRESQLGPPVTTEVLAELEISMVISNPKFRHDFNFGCKIPYVPKLRKHKSDEFWRILRLQLSEFWSEREAFIAKHPGNTWSLPILLKAIGEMLAALLPQRDNSVIREILDVDLLMQQLTRGEFNMEQLADWFSRTLRKHCAPVRDDAVFFMAEQLTTGFRNSDVEILVDGLVVLLTTIESMRLVCTCHIILWIGLTGSRMLPTTKLTTWLSSKTLFTSSKRKF